MDAAVLIPGTMGKRLLLPATRPGGDPEEVSRRSRSKPRPAISESTSVAGKIIDRVLCFSFYKSISDELTSLDYLREGELKRLEEFPYDWRKDNFVSA
ncbi:MULTISPECIES: hypothetical protein [unclassified Bradyrhizobium]|uniref:hypothetical protein n=1 Tax=unclassified Bradyrhizobium TaxID=2631580 RepID=UPI0028EABDE2|nr:MULTISPECIES: hypothetical protein [unclassified Bradyrhizobium]